MDATSCGHRFFKTRRAWRAPSMHGVRRQRFKVVRSDLTRIFKSLTSDPYRLAAMRKDYEPMQKMFEELIRKTMRQYL